MITLRFVLLSISLSFTCTRSVKSASDVTGSRDVTIIPNTSGDKVVQSVVQKLDWSNAFNNDFYFIRRLAYVQTRDGLAADTYKDPNYHGGIWNITRSMYEATMSRTLAKQYIKISLYFKIKWVATSWEDLRKPLYSGLAARLYLALAMRYVPRGVRDQAAIWAKMFTGPQYKNIRPSRISKEAKEPFIGIVEAKEEQETCSVDKFDIVFLIDGSGSVGKKHFHETKSFVQSIIDKLQIGQDKTRVAFVQYSGTPLVEFFLIEHLDPKSLKRAISRVSYKGGSTRAGYAIRYVQDHVFLERLGMRKPHELVPKILILMTDGKSHDSVEESAYRARLAGISVFAIGITKNVNKFELTKMISGPPASHLFYVKNFRDLMFVSFALEKRACDEAALWSDDQAEFSGNFKQWQEKRITILVGNDGVTLKLKAENGRVEAYGSAGIANPDRTLHHFLMNVTNSEVEMFFNPFDYISDDRSIVVVTTESGDYAIMLYITLIAFTEDEMMIEFRRLWGNQIKITENPQQAKGVNFITYKATSTIASNQTTQAYTSPQSRSVPTTTPVVNFSTKSSATTLPSEATSEILTILSSLSRQSKSSLESTLSPSLSPSATTPGLHFEINETDILQNYSTTPLSHLTDTPTEVSFSTNTTVNSSTISLMPTETGPIIGTLTVQTGGTSLLVNTLSPDEHTTAIEAELIESKTNASTIPTEPMPQPTTGSSTVGLTTVQDKITSLKLTNRWTTPPTNETKSIKSTTSTQTSKTKPAMLMLQTADPPESVLNINESATLALVTETSKPELSVSYSKTEFSTTNGFTTQSEVSLDTSTAPTTVLTTQSATNFLANMLTTRQEITQPNSTIEGNAIANITSIQTRTPIGLDETTTPGTNLEATTLNMQFKLSGIQSLVSGSEADNSTQRTQTAESTLSTSLPRKSKKIRRKEKQKRESTEAIAFNNVSSTTPTSKVKRDKRTRKPRRGKERKDKGDQGSVDLDQPIPGITTSSPSDET